MPDRYTAEDFERVRNMIEKSDDWGLPFSAYETSVAALRIASRVATPGVIDGVIFGLE